MILQTPSTTSMCAFLKQKNLSHAYPAAILHALINFLKTYSQSLSVVSFQHVNQDVW